MYIGNLSRFKKIIELIKIISNISTSPIYLPRSYKNKFDVPKMKNKVLFFDFNDYYTYMHKSEISIVSGGMSLFDALYLNKRIICLPIYNHQKRNIINNKISNKIKVIQINKKI